MICDFCSTETENVYKHVHLCPRCGLVQNEPRSNRAISTSCEADQGNLRNGKSFRFPQSLPILENIDWWRVRKALDIGSNRGAFVRWMTENHPGVTLIAVEPEERLVDYPAMIGRFEDYWFPPVDFVFSSHTLEHAQSADTMMRATERLMPVGSHMLLEIPNLATIRDPRVVEEFFIYKHNWHFSTPQLIPYLLDMGFEIEQDESTMFDVRLLLHRTREAIPYRGFGFAVEMTRQLISDYARNLERNRDALPHVVERLHQLAKTRKVAYWGAGRIFDALVRYGDLPYADVTYLVDGLLLGVVPEVHGHPLIAPNELRHLRPDAVVVLGRTSSDEMVAQASRYAPKVLTFNDLLDEALR